MSPPASGKMPGNFPQSAPISVDNFVDKFVDNSDWLGITQLRWWISGAYIHIIPYNMPLQAQPLPLHIHIST